MTAGWGAGGSVTGIDTIGWLFRTLESPVLARMDSSNVAVGWI